eukprot:scaffold102637_cov47-Phaeocystis_antarctica.AAC.1
MSAQGIPALGEKLSLVPRGPPPLGKLVCRLWSSRCHHTIPYPAQHIVTFCVPVRARPLEAPTARLDSRGYQVDGRLRPRVEGAGRYSSPSLPQLPAVERLLSAKHEVW